MPTFDPIYMASIYRLTAVNFQASAETLSEQFETGANAHNKITCIPFYFLISHAAELFLKSALLKRGFTEQDLKKHKYRHNLKSLLEELQNKGVKISIESIKLLYALHKQHNEHALRYTALVDDGKASYLPPPKLVFRMLDELLMLTRISTQGI